MDALEIILKLVTLVAAVFALPPIASRLLSSRKSQLRDEFLFIKGYIDALQGSDKAHPFVIEAGYRAISGGIALSAEEIAYLLGRPDPTQALERFHAGRDYLEFFSGVAEGHRAIGFKEIYQSHVTRKRRKGWLVVAYFGSAAIAFLPLLFARELFGSDVRAAVTVWVFTLLPFGTFAAMALSQYGRLRRAEELVESLGGKV